MSETTETTGAPEGYLRCPQKCGRWTAWAHDEKHLVRCNHCTAKDDAAMLANMESACGPDWTPPSTQPPAAAHVERRAGQRCSVTYATRPNAKVAIIELIAPCRNGWTCKNIENATFPGWINDSHWQPNNALGATLTLLTDAPPEPAKSTTPQCESFCRPGLRCKYCTTEAVGPSPPAQEAPKAAPVLRCKWEHATTPCAGPFAIRHVGMADKLEPRIWCEGHMLEYERQAASRPATGTPYAGPTRLPRPQLAADWVEDCLPTVWR